MDKMLVAVFTDLNKAYEASSALKDMHSQGVITIYSIAMVSRNRQGKTSLKNVLDEGPFGSVLAAATSGLAGLLGAPSGIAIKAAVGTLSHLLSDYRNAGVSVDFLDQVTRHMAPGRVALVAEIDEDWALPVDARMEALGGIVFRRARFGIEDAQLERDAIMLRADIVGLKAASAGASRETRAQLEARINVAQSEVQALQARVAERGGELKREADAKIRSVMGQAARAHGEVRVRLEQRIADLHAEYEARSARLNDVEQLAERTLTY